MTATAADLVIVELTAVAMRRVELAAPDVAADPSARPDREIGRAHRSAAALARQRDDGAMATAPPTGPRWGAGCVEDGRPSSPTWRR